MTDLKLANVTRNHPLIADGCFYTRFPNGLDIGLGLGAESAVGAGIAIAAVVKEAWNTVCIGES